MHDINMGTRDLPDADIYTYTLKLIGIILCIAISDGGIANI